MFIYDDAFGAPQTTHNHNVILYEGRKMIQKFILLF